MDVYGLIDRDGIVVCEPREATEEEALTFHNPGYLETLRLADSGMWVPNQFSHGLGTSDNPVFPGVYEWGMLVAGASIDGAKHILSGAASIAFNPSGGLHHAMPARASGFCHINDVVLAINVLVAFLSLAESGSPILTSTLTTVTVCSTPSIRRTAC